MLKLILMSMLMLLLAGCSNGCNPVKPPTTEPSPSPSPVQNVCNPETQPAPHYGTKNGQCLKSCGALSGTNTPKACSESGLVSAGQAYDVDFCCKQPEPPPAPTPAKCPCLNRWGVNPHITMDGAFQLVPKPVQGGYVLFDSTPRFGPGNGTPCNTEKDGCSGRLCEDPRGPLFTVVSSSPYKLDRDNSYQIRLGPLAKGTHKVTAKPRPDLVDTEGGSVNICPWSPNSDGSSTATIVVE